MRRSNDLHKIWSQMRYRTTHLAEIAASIEGKRDALAKRSAAYIAIEAYNAWVNFEREFYLSCAFLRPRQVGGGRVTSSYAHIVDEETAIRDAIPRVKGPKADLPPAGKPIASRYEPDWSRKETLVKLAEGLSNRAVIINALSYDTTFFDHLPTVRIFYAHRAIGTALKIRSLALREYGIADIKHPLDLINEVHPGRTQSLLCEWLADMQVVAEIICV